MKCNVIGFAKLGQPLCGFCNRAYDDPEVYTYPVHHHDNLKENDYGIKIARLKLQVAQGIKAKLASWTEIFHFRNPLRVGYSKSKSEAALLNFRYWEEQLSQNNFAV